MQWLFKTGFFSFGKQEKWLLVPLDRWSSYTVTILWEFAWVDSALVTFDEWLSYRGARLNRFDCTHFEAKKLMQTYMTPISGWEVLGLRQRLKGLLLLHKIRASSLAIFRLILFMMEQTLGVDSVIQALRLLTTSSQGTLFLPQMSIQTDTIVLNNLYTGRSRAILILKHLTNGMSMNGYLLWIP